MSSPVEHKRMHQEFFEQVCWYTYTVAGELNIITDAINAFYEWHASEK